MTNTATPAVTYELVVTLRRDNQGYPYAEAFMYQYRDAGVCGPCTETAHIGSTDLDEISDLADLWGYRIVGLLNAGMSFEGYPLVTFTAERVR